MLAGKLNMDPEAAEKWIVNLIRSARLSAKLDSQARPPRPAAPARRPALTGPAGAASGRRREHRARFAASCGPRARPEAARMPACEVWKQRRAYPLRAVPWVEGRLRVGRW